MSKHYIVETCTLHGATKQRRWHRDLDRGKTIFCAGDYADE